MITTVNWNWLFETTTDRTADAVELLSTMTSGVGVMRELQAA